MNYEIFPLLLVLARMGGFLYEWASAPYKANEEPNWANWICVGTVAVLFAIALWNPMF